jgi:predicted nucleic acid-binding protein
VSFVVLDTDVASASLRGRLPEQLKARLAGQSLCITFVTLGELTKWTHIRSWGPRRLADLRDWRRHVVLLPFDEAVALVWGELQAQAQHRGRPRPANDTWIAACCLVHGLPLATFNTKDFADFAANEGLQLIDAGPGPVRPT